METYEANGHKFLEVDTLSDCPNVTVTRDSRPIVLVREGEDEVIVNVLTPPEVSVRVNNKPVQYDVPTSLIR